MMIAGVAGAQDHYSRAKIYLDAGNHSLRDLAALGLATDHGEYKKNTFFTSDFSDAEIARAQRAGFKVDIVIVDVVKYYENQNRKAAKTTTVTCDNAPAVDVPSHFHLGSYAGYFTYSEALAILDSMQLLYPGLVSMRQAIDTFHTIEGRPIYWLRISNNPAVDQPAKPQMLVTAVHHAREPGSLSVTLFYMWYLLEHYATDPQIKAIVDNTELYFIPCVNPDGYLYNIAAHPAGGGMIRKNRRINPDGTHGVDLNRNYGYEWAYDNIGSSPIDSMETYRGAAAFSEPETQAIKWFAEHHHFKLNLNYHSFNNDIIYPWGYIPSFQTPDSATFFADGAYITQASHYRFGTCDQMLDYVTNGDSDDWMYGDVSGKSKVFAITPEVGALENGFYPPVTSIVPDCQNNLISNIRTASLLLPCATVKSADQKILLASSGYLHYNVQRLGFPDTATFTLQVLPLDGWMTVDATPKVYTGLSMLQRKADSVSYTLAAGTPNGQLIGYVLKLDNGLYVTYDTVQFYYGKYYTVTTPSTETLNDWYSSGWSMCSSSYYTAPASIKSADDGSLPCPGNYFDGVDATISTLHSIDLTHSTEAYLNFYAKWSIESNYDYAIVAASPAGLTSWQPLCGKYTKPGGMYQGYTSAVYDGQQPEWVQEQINLADFLGQKINIMFELQTDTRINYDGFYFDNFEVRTVEDSASQVNHTGLSQQQAELPMVRLFPIPASNEINISVTNFRFAQPLSCSLYDGFGREVMHFETTKNNSKINVSQLPVGIYFLRMSSDSVIVPVQKVCVSR
jgi:hypothetical protein